MIKKNNTIKHSVVLIHGIRTRAEWQEMVADILETEAELKVIPVKYEFFDVVRFILPISIFRKKPIERVAKIIRDEKDRDVKISVIAHSFGTYIVSKILQNFADIQFDRIILCGSIIRDDYPWELVKGRVADGDSESYRVLNDCGMKDILPVIAKTITWGYGSSGRHGFGHNRVKDRFFNKGHSDFFQRDFVKEYWLPFIRDGEVKRGEIPKSVTPWLISVLSIIQLKYLILLSLIIGFIIYGFSGTDHQTIDDLLNS